MRCGKNTLGEDLYIVTNKAKKFLVNQEEKLK